MLFEKLRCKHHYIRITDTKPNFTTDFPSWDTLLACGKCGKEKTLSQPDADMLLRKQYIIEAYKEEHDEF